MTKNDVVLDNIVEECSSLEETVFDKRYTKTSQFVLPMVELNMRNRLLGKYLNNAFLEDAELEHDFKRPVFVLLNVKSAREADWIELLRHFRTNENLKKLYLYDYYVGKENNMHLIMYVFSVPDKWSSDFYKFKRGDYSKMSDAYKGKFPQEVSTSSGKMGESLMWGAMHKSDKMKEKIKELLYDPKDYYLVEELDEIWGIPIKERECFRYKKKGV